MAVSPLLLDRTRLAGNGNSLPSEGPRAELIEKEPPEEGEAPISAPNIRQIPARLWTPKVQEEIALFLDAELQFAEAERGDLIRKFAEWKIAYRAPSADSPKNYPIFNSSNLTIAVIKEIVNTLVAQLVQSTMTTHPVWVMQGLAAEWEPFIDDIEQFLDLAADRDLKIHKSVIPAIVEMAKLGTAIIETSHEVDVRNNYKVSANGKKSYKSERIFHDGPITRHIPLQRFWIRMFETDIQEARWCAVELDYSSAELLQKEKQGKFYGVKDVIRFGRSAALGEDEVEKEEDEEALTSPSYYDSYKIFKINLSWDIDGDGYLEELELYYNRESRKFICVKFNPAWHGRRPYTKFDYFPVENRFYAEGLCGMLEDIQKGISDKNNKRSDNEAMANLKMFLKRKMVKGLMPGDPLYNGKIIEVNDIWNDVREFQMAEIYPSTVQSEILLWQRAERLSGVSEAQTGGAMPVSRTTAAAQLALLQEQAKRVDLTVRNIREGMNEIGWFTTQLYFQYGTHGKAVMWLGRRGEYVEAIFRLPRRIVEVGLAIKTQTPTSIQNRQVKRENSIALLNLLTQVHEKLMPFAQMLAPDQMAQVAHGMVRSASRFLEDTLETFETPDPEELLAGLTVLEKVLPAPEDLGGSAAYRDLEARSKSDEHLARLEGLLRQVESFGAGVDRLPDRGVQRGRVEESQRVSGRGAPDIALGGPSY